MPPAAMIVAGIMSGTSADGIDVALVRIEPQRTRPRLALLAHRAFPFPRPLRAEILTAMAGQSGAANTTTARLARLHWRLGLAYAEALQTTIRDTKITPALTGCHGQTVYHQGVPAPFAGRRFSCTWQLGEPALIASATRIPVVSNFRPADMAAGGQGAPLVPLLDLVLYAHPSRARILQNIGGIANLTAIPAAASPDQVLAFDTGPGNMVIDALMQQLFSRPYDRNGRTAARGTVLEPVLATCLQEKFFRQTPPKSAGREQFGATYAGKFLAACRKVSRQPEDAIATATALTAQTIADAIRRWVLPRTQPAPLDLIVSGGGARNTTLLSAIEAHLAQTLNPALDLRIATSADPSAAGQALPVEAKEAAAFALLAWQTWHHRPGNVPSATGATRPTILGQITYV